MIKLDDFIGSQVQAIDGALGKIDDVLFDDRDWTIQYLVVDIGDWFKAHKVLLSPPALDRFEPDQKKAHVKLTRDEIAKSMSADAKPTVSQQSRQLSLYYQTPVYWWGSPYPYGWGAYVPPGLPREPGTDPELQRRRDELANEEVHLRSFKEVKKYNVSTPDAEFGHVEDMLADDTKWIIRHLDVDTKNFLPSKHVLLEPSDVREISWSAHEIRVALSKEQVMNAPRAQR